MVRITNPSLAIINGLLWIDGAFEADLALLIDGDRIEAIMPAAQLPATVRTLDARGHYVAPGFIDLLNHGAGGHAPETNAPAVARFLPRFGVTWWLPSLLTQEFEQMLASARTIAAQVGPVAGGATIGGIHAEGPFLNPKYGGQKASATTWPTADKVEQLLTACAGKLRRMTLAPEVPHALEAIDTLRVEHVQIAIGHSEANAAQYRAARAHGANHLTHIMNALGHGEDCISPRGVRATGLEELALVDNGLTTDLISDCLGAHVSAPWQQIVLRCKGLERLSLVSDSMPPAGLAPGTYTAPDGQALTLTAGQDLAWLPGGLLYGFCGGLNDALRNFIRHTGTPLASALPLVTTNPARLMGMESDRGELRPGLIADVVLLDQDCHVHATLIGGARVYEAAPDALSRSATPLHGDPVHAH